jgi:hypothetical protein
MYTLILGKASWIDQLCIPCDEKTVVRTTLRGKIPQNIVLHLHLYSADFFPSSGITITARPSQYPPNPLAEAEGKSEADHEEPQQEDDVV